MSRPALVTVAAGILAAAVITTVLARVGPRVSRALLRWAALHCFGTDELRERFAEEWLADLEDVPGRLAKLTHTAGVLLLAAAPIWARSVWRRSWLARRLDRDASARPGPRLAVTSTGSGSALAHAGALTLVLAVTGLVAVPSVASTLRLFQSSSAVAAAPEITGLLNPNGPPPGSLTCPTAPTCYDQAHFIGLQATGRLYVSTDGARTWQDIPLSSGLTFTSALVCQTAQICSAGVEDHGKPAFTITRDGGRTWTTNPLPAAAGIITGLSCPTATTCRALAGTETRKRSGSRVLAMLTTDHLLTTDDGQHFAITTVPAVGRFNRLSCPTASHCVVTGAGAGHTLVSDDSGGTWHQGSLPHGVRTGYSLDCVDAQHCFLVGQRMSGSVLLVSDDGGATWQQRMLPARYPDPGIDSLTCVSVSTCYVTGSDDVVQSFDNGTATSGSTPIAAITQDAGLTWRGIGLPGPSSLPLPPGEPPDVFMYMSNRCLSNGLEHQAT